MWTSSDFYLQILSAAMGLFFFALAVYALFHNHDRKGAFAMLFLACAMFGISLSARRRLKRKLAAPPPSTPEDRRPRDWMGKPLE